ncbi:MAG: CobW family GTP-binding protein [Sporichthyaceae bacterium]
MVSQPTVPVVVLTGYLGAGKTTLLNHLLRRSGARVGVIVNDFGSVNIDAGLITGQIDEPASIAGGCLCCIANTDELDEALAKLSRARMRLDAIVVEASGLAEPGTLARLIRTSRVDRIRPGGVVDVIDAAEYFGTLDDGRGAPPVRFASASLVVVNKLDQVPAHTRTHVLAAIDARIRARHPDVLVVRAEHCRIDPKLIFDVALDPDASGQLSIDSLLREAAASEHLHDDDYHHDHQHAESVTLTVSATVEPRAVLTFLRDPPATAYRVKGTVAVAVPTGALSYHIDVVGGSAYVRAAGGHIAPVTAPVLSQLVAIGLNLDVVDVRRRLAQALAPAAQPDAPGVRALHRLHGALG